MPLSVSQVSMIFVLLKGLLHVSFLRINCINKIKVAAGRSPFILVVRVAMKQKYYHGANIAKTASAFFLSFLSVRIFCIGN